MILYVARTIDEKTQPILTIGCLKNLYTEYPDAILFSYARLEAQPTNSSFHEYPHQSFPSRKSMLFFGSKLNVIFFPHSFQCVYTIFTSGQTYENVFLTYSNG